MNTQITPLVEQVVMKRLTAKASFTALDISNALKSDRYIVTHREVAEIIRDIYQSDAMDFYDYRRRLIDVTTDGGTRTTQAFLYLHSSAKEREYADRQQSSLPPVTPDKGRALPNSSSAFVLPHTSHIPKTSRKIRRRNRTRCDGALAVPKILIAKFGWTVGTTLGLTVEGRQVRLARSGAIPVQVWKNQRVRISRRKLCLCGFEQPERTLIIVDTDGLRIEEN